MGSVGIWLVGEEGLRLDWIGLDWIVGMIGYL